MKKVSYLLCLLSLNFFHPCYGNYEESRLADPVQTGSATLQSQIETQVFTLINQNREANGLAPLSWSNIVATQARNHSLNMANKTVPFGHQGSDVRYANLKALISGIKRFGENVAYNRGLSDPGARAVAAWLGSSGHYANIMGDFTQTGVGVAKNLQGEYYFTQIFIKAPVAAANFEAEETSENSRQCSCCFGPLEAVSDYPYLLEIED